MKRLFSFTILLFSLALSVPLNGAVIRGEGDFEFYIDLSAFPSENGKVTELIQISVPTRDIEYKKVGDHLYKSLLELEVSLRDSHKQVVFSKGYRIKDERDSKPAAKDISSFVYLTDSCRVYPGNYTLDARVKDLNNKKGNAFSILKRSYAVSRLSNIPVKVPEFPARGIVLSEPVLVWSKRGERFVPNPMRIYGLRNDTLTYFVRAYMKTSVKADSIDLRTDVLDYKGVVVLHDSVRAGVIAPMMSFVRSIDISAIPAGQYRLIVEAGLEGAYHSTAKDFNVSWELMNWQKPQRELLVEARILLDDEQYETFKKNSLGEQESMLDSLWRKLDPTPHTAKNEAFEKFMARLRYADNNFGSLTRGALTDRGILYIRFGPPDEIIKQVVPNSGDDLTEAMDKLTDRYKIVVHSFTLRQGPPGARRHSMNYIKDSQSKLFRGFAGSDAGAYELWIYNVNGDPILKKDRVMTVASGLRLLFEDKDGFGEYDLVGTSEDMFSD